MKSLTEWRITGKTTQYAPSPFSAGLCLIWLGLGLIAGHLIRLPRRMFFTVQAALVWQWFGQRNYTHGTALHAWVWTLVSVCFYVAAGWLLAWWIA